MAMAENVRAALALVARGEAVLGIVYATDAKVEPNVKVVGAFPEGSHPAIIYPVALTKTAKPDAARYLAFLRSQTAKVGVRDLRLLVPDPADVVTARSRRKPWTSLSQAGRDERPCLTSPEEWTAIHLSLRIAIVATMVALPFGIAIAWLLARKNFWGKALLDGMVHLPLVLPPVVTGYLLLISFGRRGPIGAFLDQHFGIVFSFRWTGAALACGIMGFPLLVRPIRLAIEAIDRKLEDAAATLGAEPLLGLPHRHAAARPARADRRLRAVLRQGAGRIRRHHHLRLQHSGRDADHLGGDLHADAGARRRRGRAAVLCWWRSSSRWSRWSPPNGWRGAPRTRFHGE